MASSSCCLAALALFFLYANVRLNLAAQNAQPPTHSVVLHAARLLDIESGRMLTPAEVLVEGERIWAIEPCCPV